MTPRLIVEQKITAFVNKYKIFAVDAQGNKTQLIALAQQKRLAFKEKVTFYSDETKTTEVFSFRAEKVMDVHGRYFVEDAAGTVVGAFKKEFGKSLLNSTWSIIDGANIPKITIRESNDALAILRRFVGFIPLVGDVFEMILLFFRYHFVFLTAGSEQAIGKYQKKTLFRDHYVLSLTNEAVAQTDWRVFAAMAVALDALQSR